MRGVYPWKIGATSFILPASVEENVRYLAGKVDDVQLLFFESSWQARLPSPIDVDCLAQFSSMHSYTVHLPLDLRLGAQDGALRMRGVEEICRIVEVCDCLNPVAYDLHLNREGKMSEVTWHNHCTESLRVLQERLGSAWDKLCVENIDYDFALVAEVVATCEVKVCVDFGHLHHFGFADEHCFATYDIQHIHLHGVQDGKDHQPLLDADIPFLQRLGQEMVAFNYTGVVTLEVYKSEWLSESLDVLKQAWDDLF